MPYKRRPSFAGFAKRLSSKRRTGAARRKPSGGYARKAKPRRKFTGASPARIFKRQRPTNVVRLKRSRGAIGGTSSISAVAGNGMKMSHREFLTDVVAGPLFAIQFQGGINAGNKTLFPWLSALAQSFQRYRFTRLQFHYHSTSGNTSVSQALGEVMMAYHDNVSYAAPANKQELLVNSHAAAFVASSSGTHTCNVSNNYRYVRGSAPAFETESHGTRDTYDEGRFFLASQGIPNANTTIGELWVSYTVELEGKMQASKAAYSAGTLATSCTMTQEYLGLPYQVNGSTDYGPQVGTYAGYPTAPMGRLVPADRTASDNTKLQLFNMQNAAHPVRVQGMLAVKWKHGGVNQADRILLPSAPGVYIVYTMWRVTGRNAAGTIVEYAPMYRRPEGDVRAPWNFGIQWCPSNTSHGVVPLDMAGIMTQGAGGNHSHNNVGSTACAFSAIGTFPAVTTTITDDTSAYRAWAGSTSSTAMINPAVPNTLTSNGTLAEGDNVAQPTYSGASIAGCAFRVTEGATLPELKISQMVNSYNAWYGAIGGSTVPATVDLFTKLVVMRVEDVAEASTSISRLITNGEY